VKFPGIELSFSDVSWLPLVDSVLPTSCRFYHRETLEIPSQSISSAAEDVLVVVNTAMNKFGAKTITTVGHSLGKSIVVPWWVRSLTKHNPQEPPSPSSKPST
jgi:hypothetical protein